MLFRSEWGCHFLFQGIFLTQRLSPRLLRLPHWQAGSLPLLQPGEPGRILGGFILRYQRKTNTCVFRISNRVQVNLILEELPKEPVCGLQGTQGDGSNEPFPHSYLSTGPVDAGREGGDGLAAIAQSKGPGKLVKMCDGHSRGDTKYQGSQEKDPTGFF